MAEHSFTQNVFVLQVSNGHGDGRFVERGRYNYSKSKMSHCLEKNKADITGKHGLPFSDMASGGFVALGGFYYLEKQHDSDPKVYSGFLTNGKTALKTKVLIAIETHCRGRRAHLLAQSQEFS